MVSTEIVDILRDLLETDTALKLRLEQQLENNKHANPSLDTNPVRSLDDLYEYAERFLTTMPWQLGARSSSPANDSIFRRIDQKIGYFYYIFGDLQYEPLIADWIKQYNAAWGEFLDSPESWNNEYYEQIKQDPLFELDTDKYESPTNWHSWNDFFSRRLQTQPHGLPLFPPHFQRGEVPKAEEGYGGGRGRVKTLIAEGIHHPWLPIRDNILDIKTAKITNITDLLGDSPEKQWFQNGRFCHITLDIFNYHRFHSPCDGEILDIREIDGNLSAGGKIIWDSVENRYRYEQENNIGFQMTEKRAVIVIKRKNVESSRLSTFDFEQSDLSTYIALIPVGVAQVGSIRLNKEIKVGAHVHAGQELGYFRCGGSDIVIIENIVANVF